MRFWRVSLVGLLVLAFGWLGAGMASAATLSMGGKVHLIGKIAPAHYVIINNSDKITQVISNTYEDTVPLVYKDQLASGRQTPLTAEVYKQYQQLILPGRSHPGILYQAGKSQPENKGQVAAGPLKTPSPRPAQPALSLALTLG